MRSVSLFHAVCEGEKECFRKEHSPVLPEEQGVLYSSLERKTAAARVHLNYEFVSIDHLSRSISSA